MVVGYDSEVKPSALEVTPDDVPGVKKILVAIGVEDFDLEDLRGTRSNVTGLVELSRPIDEEMEVYLVDLVRLRPNQDRETRDAFFLRSRQLIRKGFEQVGNTYLDSNENMAVEMRGPTSDYDGGIR